MSVTEKNIRFTVREYFRMANAGVFGDRRVELINGRIFPMNAQADPHIEAITRGTIVLAGHFGDLSKFWLCVQATLRLNPYSAPDPDFHVFDVPAGTPATERPRPFLLIEVADKTYRRDSVTKLRQYAAAGIADYWIENLPAHRIEVHRSPVNPTGLPKDWRYADVQSYSRGQSVALLRFPRIKLSVSELLPALGAS